MDCLVITIKGISGRSMPYIRTLTSTLASVMAMLPGTVLAVTLASGSDTTQYVISLDGLDSTSCELIGAENIGGGSTTGLGTESDSFNSPDTKCSETAGGWQVELPLRHGEAEVGLEFPIPTFDVYNYGAFATWLFSEYEFGTVSVEQPTTITITVQGNFSALTETEHAESGDALVGLGLNSRASSSGRLRVFGEDPDDRTDYLLWDQEIRCLTSSLEGPTEECRKSLDFPLDQSFELSLQPDNSYRFILALEEHLDVFAGSFQVGEPSTAMLLILGTCAIGAMQVLGRRTPS
jgi:hypothetical protein